MVTCSQITCSNTYGVKFILGDVGAVLVRGDSAERILYLLGGMHILGFLADHERHVLLEGYLAVAVRVYHICKTIIMKYFDGILLHY